MAKLVNDRQAAVTIVAQAAETHADKIDDSFKAKFERYLRGREKLPEFGLVMRLIARAQRERAEALVKASDAHDRELADDSAPREARDSAASRLTAEIVAIRSTVASLYGEPLLRRLGIDGKTEVEAKAVLAQGRNLLDHLKNPEIVWPAPRRRGVKVDPTAWIQDLEAPLSDLTAALAEVARGVREAQATLDVKTRAMGESDELFSCGAEFLSAAFRLVGEVGLASRVRPSITRPGRTREEGEPGGRPGEGNAASGAEG